MERMNCNDFFSHCLVYTVENHACFLEMLFPRVKKNEGPDEERDRVLDSVDHEFSVMAANVFPSDVEPGNDDLPPVPAAAVGLRFAIDLPTRKPVVPRPPSPPPKPVPPSKSPVSSSVGEEIMNTFDRVPEVPTTGEISPVRVSSSSPSHNLTVPVLMEEGMNSYVVGNCVFYGNQWYLVTDAGEENRPPPYSETQELMEEVVVGDGEHGQLSVEDESERHVQNESDGGGDRFEEVSPTSPLSHVLVASDLETHSSVPVASPEPLCDDISPATFEVDKESGYCIFELGPSKSSDLSRLDQQIVAGKSLFPSSRLSVSLLPNVSLIRFVYACIFFLFFFFDRTKRAPTDVLVPWQRRRTQR
jgi:hypothetical protein